MNGDLLNAPPPVTGAKDAGVDDAERLVAQIRPAGTSLKSPQVEQPLPDPIVRPAVTQTSGSLGAVTDFANRFHSTALAGLLFLAILYTVYFAAELLIPITLAVFVKILFAPLVRRLNRAGIPSWASAAAIVITLVTLSLFGIGGLSEPAEKWLTDAPTTLRDLTHQTQRDGSLKELTEISEQIEELTKPLSSPEVQTVVMRGPGILESLLGGIPRMLQFLAIVLFLSFFLLASGDRFLRRAVRVTRQWHHRRRLVTVVGRIQTEIARYLGVLTLINIALGVSTAVAMMALGVPNPALWGVMVGLFNFAPYLGAAVSFCVLSFVGFSTFEITWQAAAVPGVFLCLTMLEGQLLTPLIVSRRLSLNPAIVFLSVVVWGWLWGVAGALLAVPIVASLKIVMENSDRLKPIADLMSE